MKLTPEEQALVNESTRCEACGHLDCFHYWASGRSGCDVAGCLCEDERMPTSDEIAQMWWLTLSGREEYLPAYLAARAKLERELERGL